LRRRERPDVFDTASGVPRLYFCIYFGPFCARLVGCHVFRIDWERCCGGLFERVVVDGANAVVCRRGDRRGDLRESVTDSGNGRGDFTPNLGMQADQLGSALTDIASEGKRLNGRPAARLIHPSYGR
jgi:hypothetical protein